MKGIILTISIGLLLACQGATTPTGVQPIDVTPGPAVDVTGSWAGTLTVVRSELYDPIPCADGLPDNGMTGSLRLTIRSAGSDRVTVDLNRGEGQATTTLDGKVTGTTLTAHGEPYGGGSCGTANTSLSASLSGNELVGKIHTIYTSFDLSTQTKNRRVVDAELEETFKVGR